MTRELTIIAAAVSISCGIGCSSTITAEPWLPKPSRSAAAEHEPKDAGADEATRADAESDRDSGDDEDSDAGE
jgi:hypothetical protein